MGLFRRAKESPTPMTGENDITIQKEQQPLETSVVDDGNSNSNKKKLGGLLAEKAGNLLRWRPPVGGEDVETIGDELAPEDQFVLVVPVKTNVQKKKDTLFSRTTTGSKSKTSEPTSEETSTVSSLTYYSDSQSNRALRHKLPRSTTTHNTGCCGSCVTMRSMTSTKQRDKKQQQGGTSSPSGRLRPAPPCLWFSCGGGGDPIESETTTTSKTTGTFLRCARPRHALFDDTLEDDDEAASMIEGATTAAHDDNHTINTKNSAWKRFLSKKRSVPKFRSFKLRGKSKKTAESNFVF